MQIVSLIARYLMGALFIFFGANGIFKFLKQLPPPSRLGAAFNGVLTLPSYVAMVFGCELVCGVLLLANRFVPLALTVRAGILLNVLLYHIAFEKKGLPIGIRNLCTVGACFSPLSLCVRQLVSSEGSLLTTQSCALGA